jgi:hypothetical protein
MDAVMVSTVTFHLSTLITLYLRGGVPRILVKILDETRTYLAKIGAPTSSFEGHGHPNCPRPARLTCSNLSRSPGTIRSPSRAARHFLGKT